MFRITNDGEVELSPGASAKRTERK